jgi:predicted ferric reductase
MPGNTAGHVRRRHDSTTTSSSRTILAKARLGYGKDQLRVEPARLGDRSQPFHRAFQGTVRSLPCMDEVIPLTRSAWSTRTRSMLRRRAAAAVVYAIAAANAGIIVWLWIHGGNLHSDSTGDLFTSIGRITGLLAAYLALLQVILLARLPALERAVGLDRLSVWHRWNGHACIDLVVAHVIFTVWGYALMDKFTIGKEIATMLGGGVYPGMITATIGTVMLLGVVATSLVIVRRRLSYEWWYAVHLLAYAGIALSWFHEIPTGNELVLDRTAADYWRGLYVATLAVLGVFRLGIPLVQLARHRSASPR